MTRVILVLSLGLSLLGGCSGESAPRVRLQTTKGPVVLELLPDAAPRGVARFRELVAAGFYQDVACFRVVPGFVVQFGISGDPAVTAKWLQATIPDDPPKASNTRGYVTFATAGPNSRTTQVFINLGDNRRLDAMGFAPFARVVEGMENVDRIHSSYGERPRQERIVQEGNAYLKANFPQLDSIVSVQIE